MPRKRWRHPRALRMALAEYFMQQCGLKRTEAEIRAFAAQVKRSDSAFIPVRLTPGQQERVEAALKALLEEI